MMNGRRISVARGAAPRAARAASAEGASRIRELPAPVARQASAPGAAVERVRRMPPALARQTSAPAGGEGRAPLMPPARARGFGAAPDAPAGPPPATAVAGAPVGPGPVASEIAEAEPAALFPIVQAVARGHSGAAGYAYAAAEPPEAVRPGEPGAGLRCGLVAARLDTGDLGALLALARERDPEGFDEAFGGAAPAQALLATASAESPSARLAPVEGAPLWEGPWPARFAAAAERQFMQAAQNEFAIEQQLRPMIRALARPGFPRSAVALALAYDVIVAEGLARGLQTVRAALDALGAETLTDTMLCDGLAMMLPGARPRLRALKADAGLAASPLFGKATP